MSELLPCPSCGETPELSKHFKDELWQMIHRCKVMGAITIDWTGKDRVIERWNTRQGIVVPVTEEMIEAGVIAAQHLVGSWAIEKIFNAMIAASKDTGGDND